MLANFHLLHFLSFLQDLPSLQYLSLQGNPVCHDTSCRHSVLYQCQKLAVFDEDLIVSSWPRCNFFCDIEIERFEDSRRAETSCSVDWLHRQPSISYKQIGTGEFWHINNPAVSKWRASQCDFRAEKSACFSD